MQLEATHKPLRYRLRDGREILISPGQPVDLPDEAARKLLARAPDRVKVAALPAIPIGSVIRWQSPLFHGELVAAVLAVSGQSVTVHHPLTQRVCTIPAAWLTGRDKASHTNEVPHE